MKYGSFGQRLSALIIDTVLLFPLVLVSFKFYEISKTSALVGQILVAVLGAGYHVFFHARWGQTVGKKLTRIKVVKTTGEPLGWIGALKRSSIDILFQILFLYG